MLLTRRQALLEEFLEYSPEWGCSECDKLKVDLSVSQDADDRIRTHLDEILKIHHNYMITPGLDLSHEQYFKIVGFLIGICGELGVSFLEKKAVR